ncbi:MAG: DNA recombination protein RmuC, partial [Verrucomicrobiota bacterium]|nr:DNA recombination protein RmuC [Verrucomicrobiota bacterium]
QIETLSTLNKELSNEAKELANALKGDNKVQGNWGEQVLENILERSGLRKNIDYTREEILEIDSIDGDGRADVIVKIPDGGSIIIDSKLSFKSYLNYSNVDSLDEKEIFLEDLIKSTKAHIKNLSSKNYWSAKKIKTPDFTLMFMPIDNLFHLIVNHDKEIYDMAFENRIIFVGPSTLMASLKTISVLWREVGLSKNTEQIAEESGKLYDKFSLFVEDLIDVQKRLNTAMEKNTEALKKLYSGPGNIISKIQKIQDLGAKTTKQIDEESIEELLKK